MCAILGIIHQPQALFTLVKGLNALAHRGKDSYGICNAKHIVIQKTIEELRESLHTSLSQNISQSPILMGHALHAIVSHVPQPLTAVFQNTQSHFVANCEIYNWQELHESHIHSQAKNDTQVLHAILHDFLIKRDVKLLNTLNGVYAAALLMGNELLLIRDSMGEKPLHIAYNAERTHILAFASEAKALKEMGFDYKHIEELHPRTIMIYNFESRSLTKIKRPFFRLTKNSKKTSLQLTQDVAELFETAVLARVASKKKIGLLLSGGVDSTLIGFILHKHKIPFTCYTAALTHEPLAIASDLIMARQAATLYHWPLRESLVTIHDVKKHLPDICQIIESSNVVKVGVALPFFFCCKQAKEDEIQVLFSGLGSEELYAGYERHLQSNDINKECLSGLRKMFERDLYRDDCITMAHTIELRLPFLDITLIKHALTIPAQMKIVGDIKKKILRDAATLIGLDKSFSERPKKAAQYGSLFDKALERISKDEKFSSKSAFLNSLYTPQNQRLAILLSTGKDSLLAAYIMKKQNYPLCCAVTINSQNPDSFMYHTPATHLAVLQAEAMNIPHIIQKTHGKKEDELQDLEKALYIAKKTYGAQGIVTGALFSTYQRERIEKVAERVGLTVFSPLWHMNQQKEVQQLLDYSFEFVLTRIAAQGLTSDMLMQPFNQKTLQHFVSLQKKIGINIAGEGGEYESLVLWCPLFSKRLIIDEYTIQTIDRYSAIALIQAAHLEPLQEADIVQNTSD